MTPTTMSAVRRAAEPVVFDQRLLVVRAGPRCDPFARLVRQVAEDPDNAWNLDRYLWVLEEAAPEPCECCGSLFVPSVAYLGAWARGSPRRYCSKRCVDRVAYRRRRDRGGRRSAAA